LNDQVKEDERAGRVDALERTGINTGFWWGSLKKIDH
jgi:hypothetical protein